MRASRGFLDFLIVTSAVWTMQNKYIHIEQNSNHNLKTEFYVITEETIYIYHLLILLREISLKYILNVD